MSLFSSIQSLIPASRPYSNRLRTHSNKKEKMGKSRVKKRTKIRKSECLKMKTVRIKQPIKLWQMQ